MRHGIQLAMVAGALLLPGVASALSVRGVYVGVEQDGDWTRTYDLVSHSCIPDSVNDTQASSCRLYVNRVAGLPSDAIDGVWAALTKTEGPNWNYVDWDFIRAPSENYACGHLNCQYQWVDWNESQSVPVNAGAWPDSQIGWNSAYSWIRQFSYLNDELYGYWCTPCGMGDNAVVRIKYKYSGISTLYEKQFGLFG